LQWTLVAIYLFILIIFFIVLIFLRLKYLFLHEVIWNFIFYVLGIHYIVNWRIMFFCKKFILFIKIYFLFLRLSRRDRWSISCILILIILYFDITKMWILVLILFLNNKLTNSVLFILYRLLWIFAWKRALAIERLGKTLKPS
jgi:hypothetical protein